MASYTMLSAIALAFCLTLVQCQSEFEFDGRDFGPRRDVPFTVPECRNKVMDIFFVLDSSTSIWVNDVEREREFVRDVVGRLEVDDRATRVGVLTFSDDIQRPTLGLGNFQVKDEIIASINEINLPYRTGITNTHLAIRYVRETAEFRQDITKVIVVITDGGSRSPSETAREAQLARENGFYLFVVGVGQYLDEREWRSIASDPDDSFIYNITNFRYLNNVRDSLAARACLLPPIIVGSCNVDQPADLYFAGTSDALMLLDGFVEKTDDENNLLRVGLAIDACTPTDSIPLNDINFYCQRTFDPLSLPTSLSNLLARVAVAARNSRAIDPTKKQVAVLFVDEDSMRASRFEFSTEARNLERDGVELVVVDLGVRSYVSNLQNLATDRNNYVRFLPGSLIGQETAQTRFLDTTCEAVNRNRIVGPDPL